VRDKFETFLLWLLFILFLLIFIAAGVFGTALENYIKGFAFGAGFGA
jgi:hypothetical protein